MNPIEILMKFVLDNIFFFLVLGFGVFFILTYLKFGRRVKFKIIDREELERQKFIQAMKFNTPPKDSKYLYRGDFGYVYMNGGKGVTTLKKKETYNNLVKVGKIQKYMEFEQKPIKPIEMNGIVKYIEDKDEPTMKLVAMVVKPTLFWFITNPFGKDEPMIIENNEETLRRMGNTIVIPSKYAIDRFSGFYYMINENIKPKIRNIIDARVLVTDFNLTHSRYFAKAQEECVYDPAVASQMAQKEKELQIELAKSRGKAESV